MNMYIRKLIPFFAAAVLLQGCAIYESPKEIRAKSEADIIKTAKLRTKKPRYSNIEIMKRIYVEQVTIDEAKRPSWTNKAIVDQRISSSMKSALNQAFNNMGVHFKFIDEVDINTHVQLSLKGSTYFDALEAIAASSGYSFEIHNKSVTWSRFKVASFKIAMVPGIEEFGIGKKGEKTINNSSQSIEVTKATVISSKDEFAHTSGSLNAIQDMLEGVQLLLSDDGKVQLMGATTTLIVKDYPSNVAKAAQFIREENETLTQQVSLSMVVYDVMTTDETMGSLDWQVVAKELAGRGVDMGATSIFGEQAATSSSAPMLLDFTRTDGQFAGSQILLKALQSQGAVNVKTLPMSTAMNNRVAKLRSIDRTNFILERSITNTVNIGTEGSIKQGTVETGFSLYLLPTIVDGKVIMRVTTNMSALVNLTKKGAVETEGDSTSSDASNVYVEAPEVADKDFDNTVMIPNGKTLLVAAYSSEIEISKDTNAGLDVLGTAKTSSKRRVETIIAITPTIIGGIL